MHSYSLYTEEYTVLYNNYALTVTLKDNTAKFTH